MRYILDSEDRRLNCLEHIRQQKLDKPLQVDVKIYKKNRSNAQNNTLWMFYADLADHFGYTPEELHEELKVKFLGIEEKMIAGELIRQPISTTGLSTKEMADYLNKVEILARNQGVVLRYPDDYRFAMMYD